jgi:hypothetical protein
LQQQANMLSQEVLSEASMYKPASTAAAPPTVVVDDVDGDGIDGQRDGQETPRPASVNAAAGALPALPALPTRKRP